MQADEGTAAAAGNERTTGSDTGDKLTLFIIKIVKRSRLRTTVDWTHLVLHLWLAPIIR